MSDLKAAKRYAQALFLVAKDKNALDPLAQDISALSDALNQSEDLRLFIRNPILEKEDRSNVVRNVFEGRAHPSVVTFLLFLIEKNRLNLLGDIVLLFKKIYKAEKHLLDVYVETEREIEPLMLKELNDKISERFSKKVETTVKVNPEILGGFKVRINDVVFDASLKMQLRKFQENVFSTI